MEEVEEGGVGGLEWQLLGGEVREKDIQMVVVKISHASPCPGDCETLTNSDGQNQDSTWLEILIISPTKSS